MSIPSSELKPWEIPTAVLGAGAVLIHQDRVLLVQVNYGKAKGQWILPGGRVEPHERLEEAVIREVVEECGISAEFLNISGMLGVRHRLLAEGKGADVYFLFLLSLTDEKGDLPALAWPEDEILEARFWPVAEAVAAQEVRPVTRAAIELGIRTGAQIYARHSSRAGFIPEDTLYCSSP
jgi:ADP-ribose pyrophosphatase YjhB (NUDIX family)